MLLGPRRPPVGAGTAGWFRKGTEVVLARLVSALGPALLCQILLPLLIRSKLVPFGVATITAVLCAVTVVKRLVTFRSSVGYLPSHQP